MQQRRASLTQLATRPGAGDRAGALALAHGRGLIEKNFAVRPAQGRGGSGARPEVNLRKGRKPALPPIHSLGYDARGGAGWRSGNEKGADDSPDGFTGPNWTVLTGVGQAVQGTPSATPGPRLGCGARNACRRPRRRWSGSGLTAIGLILGGGSKSTSTRGAVASPGALRRDGPTGAGTRTVCSGCGTGLFSAPSITTGPPPRRRRRGGWMPCSHLWTTVGRGASPCGIE